MKTKLVYNTIIIIVGLISLKVGCGAPFIAIAALSTCYQPSKIVGLKVIFASWLANQAVGFLILSYPLNTQAFTWGLIILGCFICCWMIPTQLKSDLKWNSNYSSFIIFIISFASYHTLMYSITLALSPSLRAYTEYLNPILVYSALLDLSIFIIGRFVISYIINNKIFMSFLSKAIK